MAFAADTFRGLVPTTLFSAKSLLARGRFVFCVQICPLVSPLKMLPPSGALGMIGLESPLIPQALRPPARPRLPLLNRLLTMVPLPPFPVTAMRCLPVPHEELLVARPLLLSARL